jgi:hypothetical protein
MEAVGRLHEVINAGVRVRGVIIADDERRQEPAPAPVEPEERRIEPPPAPARPRPSIRPVLSWIGEAWPGFVHSVGTGMSWIGKMIFGLFCVVSVLALAAGAISLVMLIVRSLAGFWPVVLVGLFIAIVTGAGSSGGISVDYDPELVILVDDGQGGTTWISLFTWYD